MDKLDFSGKEIKLFFMQSRKLVSGLDVVKFIMAIFIVDTHVKGYLITPPPTMGLCDFTH